MLRELKKKQKTLDLEPLDSDSIFTSTFLWLVARTEASHLNSSFSWLQNGDTYKFDKWKVWGSHSRTRDTQKPPRLLLITLTHHITGSGIVCKEENKKAFNLTKPLFYRLKTKKG